MVYGILGFGFAKYNLHLSSSQNLLLDRGQVWGVQNQLTRLCLSMNVETKKETGVS